MPNGLQLGPAPCSSGHLSCAAVGRCQRPEVRGQERLLVGGPDGNPGSGSKGGARRTSAGSRIPGQPLPWLSPPQPDITLFQRRSFGERNSTAARIAGLQESGPSRLVCPGPCRTLPKAPPPGPGGWHQTLSRDPQVAGLSLDSTHHRHPLSTPLHPRPLPPHQRCPMLSLLGGTCSLLRHSRCQAQQRGRRHWQVRSLQVRGDR